MTRERQKGSCTRALCIRLRDGGLLPKLCHPTWLHPAGTSTAGRATTKLMAHLHGSHWYCERTPGATARLSFSPFQRLHDLSQLATKSSRLGRLADRTGPIPSGTRTTTAGCVTSSSMLARACTSMRRTVTLVAAAAPSSSSRSRLATSMVGRSTLGAKCTSGRSSPRTTMSRCAQVVGRGQRKVERLTERTRPRTQHMRSAEHVGLHFPCPGANCGRKFRNRGDLTAHWEQGTCPSDINRTTIDYFIRANDKNRMITSGPPRQLLTDAASPIVYLATERSYSWTRQAYVCALCRSEHRTLHSLNQHLASPRHTHAGVGDGLKPYKCPAATCGRHFLTLSAVIRHAEQGVCPVLQSPPMSRALDDAFGGMRQLTCR